MVKLYLGVRKQNYNIYGKDLALSHQINPALQTIIKYEDVDGILDIDSIFNEKGFKSAYFISGPQKMISSFKSRLISSGLHEWNVKTDEWE